MSSTCVTQQDGDSAQTQVAWLTAACRACGLKITAQRLAIFGALAAAADHPTAEAIHARVVASAPGLSLDTVYRTLSALYDHGLIQRLEVLDDRARFDANLRTHHHLVCVRCQRIEDVDWPALDRVPLPSGVRAWGAVDRVHAEIRGLCRACQAGVRPPRSQEE